MDARFESRTRSRVQTLSPGAWWTVAEVAIEPGSLGLYYRLGQRRANPAELRDERGRTVLEAFGSLPMEAMAEALDDYRRSLVGLPEAKWDQATALAVIPDLNAFIRTFGPLGIGWGGEFGVQNPDADRLQREADRQAWRDLGIDPDSVAELIPQRPHFWIASFFGHAPGRGKVPIVSRREYDPTKAWAERVRRRDDGLPHDEWFPFLHEYQDLRRTLPLAEAIAVGDPVIGRTALRAFFPNDDWEFSVTAPDSELLDFAPALKGLRPSNGRARLFRLPHQQVDWIVAARVMLANLIERQVDFAMPRIDLGRLGRLEVGWRATSLLEVIYLQLLEQVREREGFGVGHCDNCGGPILRTRRPGKTENRWHRGCQAGRVRSWRLASPGWRLGAATRGQGGPARGGI